MLKKKVVEVDMYKRCAALMTESVTALLKDRTHLR